MTTAAPVEDPAVRPGEPLEVRVDLRLVRRAISVVIGLLFLANIPAAAVASEGDRFFFDHPQARWFLLDAERNIPTLYACVQLAVCGLLAGLHAWTCRLTGTPGSTRWLLMGGVFAFMTLDEGLSIHEDLDELIDGAVALPGWLINDWVVVAVPIALGVALFFLPWVRRLPARVTAGVLAGGALYIIGAVAFELVGGAIRTTIGIGHPLYPVASSIEELLELIGVAVVLLTLLGYLADRLQDRPINVGRVGRAG